ncbi:MAG: response regulator transcription factor [Nitrospinae bacterium]|nr:response regulator transcription factor [Nitrospinota bacterium]
MANETILVVEDEEDITDLIRYNLERENYRVKCVVTGEEAVKFCRSNPPDLMLLDLMLPGVDGLEVCKKLKSDSGSSAIPIVMVSAKGEDADVVTGLELGADDYVSKPFSPKVLVSRVRAVLRRRSMSIPGDSSVIHAGDITIHPGRHETLVKDKPAELTLTEFRILQFLARRPGWVFTRGQIVEAVRKEDYSVTDRAVDFQIVGLRKKLGPCAKYIETVRGVGYRFKE